MNSAEPTRDEQILEHIVRYRIGLRAILLKLFFETPGAMKNALQELCREKLLQSFPKKIPGGISYYLPTPATCKAFGAPRNRSEPFNTEGPLHQAIAFQWFCCMMEPRRIGLTADDLKSELPAFAAEERHCAESTDAYERLHRVYIAGSGADDSYVLRRIREHSQELTHHPVLHTWMKNGHYVFTVLAETRERVEGLREEIAHIQDRFVSGTLVEVHRAPGPRTLKGFITEEREGTSEQPE